MGGAPAHAAANAADAEAGSLRQKAGRPAEVEEIVIVAARHAQPVADVTASVLVVHREQLAQHLVRDFADVAGELPGVSVGGGDSRFSADGPRIRGLGGNRIVIEADGAPLPAGFSVGAFSAAGRDYLAPGTLSRIEVLKGPASSLHGSDALGGVIALTSLSPADAVAGGGRPWSIDFDADYHAADAGSARALRGAWSDGSTGALLHVGRRTAGAIDHAATGVDDDRDLQRDSVLAKVTQVWPSGTRAELVFERFDEAVDANLHSLLGYGRRFVTTTSLRGDDSRRGQRLVAGLDLAVPTLDEATLRAYRVDADVDQLSFETRAGNSPSRIERRFRYAHEQRGGQLDLRKSLQVAGRDHLLGIGVDVAFADVVSRRDGAQTVLATGVRSNVLLGERFPVRDFPLTKTRSLGVYAFDEVELSQSLVLIPGLRFDRFVVDARNDAIYAEDNPRATPVDVDVEHASPRLALRLRVNEAWTLHAQYATGFRAPPHDDVNIGLDLPLLGVRAIPNPDLRPERMRSLELGAHFSSPLPGLGGSLSVFAARSRDFIESRVNLGPDTAGTLVFQSRNLRRARIEGIEFAARQEFAALSDALAGWSLAATLVATRGEDRATGAPINTIDPPEARLRLAYHGFAERLRVALTAIGVRSPNLDEQRLRLFTAPGFARIDADATFDVTRYLTVRARIENLADRTYWRHARIGERPPDDPMLPALSAPGRTLAVALELTL